MSVLKPAIYATGITLKVAIIDLSTGAVRWWNTSGTPAFEAYNATHIASYGITLTEGGTTGLYTFAIPATLPASAPGNPYVATAYRIAGANLATGDLAASVWQWEFAWAGTAVIDLATIEATATVAATAAVLAHAQDFANATANPTSNPAVVHNVTIVQRDVEITD